MTRPSARHVLPEFTERTGSGHRTMDPYSKLLQERIVFLGTPIDDTSANDVMAQFMYLEHRDPDRDIALYINSPGGSFSAMTAIYDTMRYICCDVQTTCTPGKRFALPGARMVIHQPALPEPARGQVSDLAIQAEELSRTRALLEEMLVRHTGRSPEQVSADIERDMILTASQAVAYGLVDGVVPSRRDTAGAPDGR